LVALFTKAEWQKAPWDLGANTYTGACNSQPAQEGQKSAAASAFSISSHPYMKTPSCWATELVQLYGNDIVKAQEEKVS